MTKLVAKIALLVLTASITFASGIIHGRITHRWGVGEDMQNAARRLETLPHQIGSWELKQTSEIAPKVTKVLECRAYVNRTYFNRETGSFVNVVLLLGSTGPISVHTPDICYSSRDYSISSPRQREFVRTPIGVVGQFWSLLLQSNGVAQESLRVYYAWTVDGDWQASSSPRFSFAGSPFLYKLQLAAVQPSAADPDSHDACRSFLMDALPLLQKHLFE